MQIHASSHASQNSELYASSTFNFFSPHRSQAAALDGVAPPIRLQGKRQTSLRILKMYFKRAELSFKKKNICTFVPWKHVT